MRGVIIRQTLESIHAKCTEVGDCWEWSGSKRWHPSVRHGGKVVLVRRLVVELTGRTIQATQKAVATCDNKSCCNPAHVAIQSHRQVMRSQGALGKLSDPARIAKIAATKRAKYAKITMDDARAIRASDETCRQAGERYGISLGKVASIRQYRCWRELAGNPFLGLGAK